MPTYEYQCTECGERFEVSQKITDEPLTECPVCGGPLRKLFHPAGILFKGSGFYSTDSRGSGGSRKETGGDKPSEKKPSEKKSSEKKDGGSEGGSSGTKEKSA